MPLILGANSLAGGYQVKNSLRFNSGSDDSLTRTFGSSGNRKTWTFSTWIKRSNLINANMNILGTDYSGNGEAYLLFKAGEQFHYGQYEGGGTSNNYSFQTNQAFRDVSAWYNILFVWDTTQSTSSDRMKLYINGTQITSFSSATYPTQNLDGVWNSNRVHYIGDAFYGTNLDGYLSETYFIDGQALTPSSFGETDTDTNIWKPKAYTGSFGTNGFYLEFKNSASLGTDSSGNGNNFTVNNLTSIDQTTDTPTNNFATLNPLNNNTSATSTFSEGNLKIATDGVGSRSSIAVSSGKWYCEIKCVSNTVWNGVTDVSQYINNEYTTNSVALYVAGATLYVGGVNQGSGGYGSAWTANDIMNLALDLDSGTKKLYFGKNGGWWNGSTYGASSPSTGVTLTNDVTYAITVGSGSGTSTNELNFGSPPFTIVSGNADANGYGNFEYAVPSGYYALCTKNLAQFG
jgi:hypothetical protein